MGLAPAASSEKLHRKEIRVKRRKTDTVNRGTEGPFRWGVKAGDDLDAQWGAPRWQELQAQRFSDAELRGEQG